jgi:hypothetical protein
MAAAERDDLLRDHVSIVRERGDSAIGGEVGAELLLGEVLLADGQRLSLEPLRNTWRWRPSCAAEGSRTDIHDWRPGSIPTALRPTLLTDHTETSFDQHKQCCDHKIIGLCLSLLLNAGGAEGTRTPDPHTARGGIGHLA